MQLLNRYNNKTYRVDDIDWDQKPTTQFMMVDKSQQSYLEYYWKVNYMRIFFLWFTVVMIILN